jgi:hypothetical protein
MSYKVMFILNALVLLVIGLGLLFVPDMVLEQFETEAYASTVFVSRFFGLAVAALGLVLWFAGDVAEAAIQKRMAVVIFVASVAGLVLSLVGMSGLSGVLRVNGWMPLVLFVLGVLGYGFLLFLKPRMKE